MRRSNIPAIMSWLAENDKIIKDSKKSLDESVYISDTLTSDIPAS